MVDFIVRCNVAGVYVELHAPAQSFCKQMNFEILNMHQDVQLLFKGLDGLKRLQAIAKGVRIFEFIGLTLSLVSLSIAIAIFASFRRLRVFRTRVHLNLMLGLLLVTVIRLALYIDQELSPVGVRPDDTRPKGWIIHVTPILCPCVYLLLEYGKTVAFAWMFLEGHSLHNQLVFRVFAAQPQIWSYVLVGWGVSFIHTAIWVYLYISLRTVGQCLNSYFLDSLFWILDGPRMAQLLINAGFVCNVVRVLWLKMRATSCATEHEKMWKSTKAAAMLILLLGIPNVMQTIPYLPSNDNIEIFGVYTYVATFFYMFQGFMIAVLYCFTNHEVISTMRGHYERYQIANSAAADAHRRSIACTLANEQLNGKKSANGNWFASGGGRKSTTNNLWPNSRMGLLDRLQKHRTKSSANGNGEKLVRDSIRKKLMQAINGNQRPPEENDYDLKCANTSDQIDMLNGHSNGE